MIFCAIFLDIIFLQHYYFCFVKHILCSYMHYSFLLPFANLNLFVTYKDIQKFFLFIFRLGVSTFHSKFPAISKFKEQRWNKFKGVSCDPDNHRIVFLLNRFLFHVGIFMPCGYTKWYDQFVMSSVCIWLSEVVKAWSGRYMIHFVNQYVQFFLSNSSNWFGITIFLFNFWKVFYCFIFWYNFKKLFL